MLQMTHKACFILDKKRGNFKILLLARLSRLHNCYNICPCTRPALVGKCYPRALQEDSLICQSQITSYTYCEGVLSNIRHVCRPTDRLSAMQNGQLAARVCVPFSLRF